MKFDISIKKLKETVSLIERVASKHQTLPVLSCVYIEISKNTAMFKATNLDIGIEVSVPVKSEGEGSLAIPAHTLSAFLGNIIDQNQIVTVDSSTGNAFIKTNRSKGTIKTLPHDDFPVIPRVQNGTTYSIDSNQFVSGLSSVVYSASVSSVKPELSSVYMYSDKGYIVFAATDSFRLAEKRIKIPDTTKINDLLIPYKNTLDIIRVISSMSGDISVTSNKNLVSFECGDVYLVSRVIDGVFPDYRQIIPRSFTTEATALKQDVVNALKISTIFSDKFNQVHLIIDPKSKIFQIQTKNSDVGENDTNIEAALSGDRMEINFNHRYLSEGFQSIDADSVTFQLNSLNKPVVIKPVSGDQSFLYLVMPMNR